MKQESFSDMEYSCRKKKTKREEFLEVMDEIIPWDEWVEIIRPYYPTGKRGRPPIEIEIMLRMYLLQCWFSLSDEGVEDAIYDSYAMRKFMGINFFEQDVPDALAKLRLIYPHLMRLDYDNRRTREDQQITAPGRVENITPLQHLAAFYELQNNQPLTDEQAAFCQQLIEDIWKEGEDA